MFPVYNGLEDPLPWLNRCEQFFRAQQMPDDGKVWLASFYMTGDAQQWYYRLEKNCSTPTWAEFVKLANNRFGPPLRSNPFDELVQLRRMGTVAEYQSQFLTLLARCEEVTETQQIDIFTAGLRNPLRTDVELQKPATLEDAMGLARAYECCTAMDDDDSCPIIADMPQDTASSGATSLALPSRTTYAGNNLYSYGRSSSKGTLLQLS